VFLLIGQIQVESGNRLFVQPPRISLARRDGPIPKLISCEVVSL